MKDLGLTASLMLFLSSPSSSQIWDQEHTFRTFTRTGITYEYLVFTPEGEFLGVTNLPGASAISRGHLIARQDNEETGGIEMVIYRIVPAVPGLEYP